MVNFRSRALWAALVISAVGCSSDDNSSNRASEQSDTKTVEPNTEATLSAGTAVTLMIPAGSVSQSKTITVATVNSSAIAAEVPAESGNPVALTPHGTTFNTAVTVRIAAPDGADEVLRLDNEQDNTWEVVEGATIANGIATFQTNHFSIYLASKSKKRPNGTGGAKATGSSSKPIVSAGGSSSQATTAAGAGGQRVATSSISGGAASVGGSSAAGGASTAGGSVALGGSSSGGSVALGGSSSGGRSSATGGTSSISTGGSTVRTQFCADVARSGSRCESVGIEMCGSSINACCANSSCAFALDCTLRGVYGESACISDSGDAGRTLYNAAKQCLIQNEAGCGFVATAAVN